METTEIIEVQNIKRTRPENATGDYLVSVGLPEIELGLIVPLGGGLFSITGIEGEGLSTREVGFFLFGDTTVEIRRTSADVGAWLKGES